MFTLDRSMINAALRGLIARHFQCLDAVAEALNAQLGVQRQGHNLEAAVGAIALAAG